MGRLEDVIEVVGEAISAAFKGMSPPITPKGKVEDNWPDQDALIAVAKGVRGPIVSIVPIGDSVPQNTARARILSSKPNGDGTATVVRKIGSTDQTLGITVWAPDDVVRGAIVTVIRKAIATTTIAGTYLPLDDGTTVTLRKGWGPRWKDEPVSEFLLKRADVAVIARYPEVDVVQARPIASFDLSLTDQDGNVRAHVPAGGHP